MRTQSPACDVAILDPTTDEAWDNAIDSLPGSTFFHTRAWAAVLHSAYGFTPQFLAARADGLTLGALPLFEIRSWITAARGIALPYSDRCEPLATEAATATRLFQTACAIGRRRGWKRLEIRGTVPDPRATPNERYYEHQVSLTRDAQEILARVEPAVGRAIRKAERSGLSVRFADSWEALAAFRPLLDWTRRRHGAPPQPDGFFRALHEHVLRPRLGVIALAEHHKVPVAGALFLRHRGTVLFKFGASDENAQHLRPNQLVMWRAIQRFCAEGCSDLNLGRTALHNEGLRRFKRAWGARETEIGYCRFDLERNQFVTDPVPGEAWHAPIFRRLPTWAARLIAMPAYRHFA